MVLYGTSDFLLGGLTATTTTITVNLRHLEPSYRALQFGGGDGAQVAAGVGMRQQLLGAFARGLGVRPRQCRRRARRRPPGS